MKLFTFSVVVLTSSFCWAIEAPTRPRARAPFVSTSSSTSAILNLRGGDLGPVSADALAKTFGVLAIGDALSGAIKPSEVWEKFGVTLEKGSKGEHYLGHGLASSAASFAVMSLLALFGKTSTEEAIAFGYLTRAIFMSEMLLTGKYKDLGVPQAPHVLIYLILLGTAFSLMSGQGDYMAAAKLISVVLCGHGALLFLNPRIDGKSAHVSSLKCSHCIWSFECARANFLSALTNKHRNT